MSIKAKCLPRNVQCIDINSEGAFLFLKYRKVASSNTSCLEAHAGFFRLLMKGIFEPYVL